MNLPGGPIISLGGEVFHHPFTLGLAAVELDTLPVWGLLDSHISGFSGEALAGRRHWLWR